MTLVLLITPLNRTTCVGSQSIGIKPMISVWVGMSVFIFNYEINLKKKKGWIDNTEDNPPLNTSKKDNIKWGSEN